MSQQQQMNMAAMGAGGPVGGPAGPQMNLVGTPNSGQIMTQENMIMKLNTAIYDYLLRNELYSVAKELQQHVQIDVKDAKQSPNQRGQQANGLDDGMDIDSKDPGLLKRPDDLPLPTNIGGDGPFLQDWWCQFWEVWAAHRRRNGSGPISTYMTQQRFLSQQRGNNMNSINQQAMANVRGFNPMMQPNGVAMSNDLKRAAMQNNTRNMNPAQIAQMQNMKASAQNGQMMQAANQMERSGSQMDNRTGSPGSGDAPSPKRQRLEGGMQQMNQGRPGQPGQMQQSNQSVDVYSASIQRQMQAAMNNVNKPDSNVNKVMPPNMGPGGAQGSPMSQQGMDGTTGEFYATAANGGARMPMQGNAAAAAAAGQVANSNGNHALQDYQMQLMLLEQQNKKRLLMARQEQDTMSAHPGGVGPNGNFPPGSPTPGANMMDPSNIPPQMRGQMIMGPNGAMMRPPSSHPGGNLTPAQTAQMEMMRQSGMQLPNGQFPPGQGPPQGQMMPGQPGGPPGQGPQGTPRQANNMPPPPAPAANAGGTGPSSPSQQPAPPTPSTTNKPKPGNKKEAAKKGAAAKKNAANATPASESEHPPTPTPATPITPMNPKSFNNQQMSNGQPTPAQNQLNAQANNQQQGQQQNANAVPQPDPTAGLEPFGSLDSSDQFGMDLNFGLSENGDVLDNFDFDSFLNNDGDGGLTFDANFAFDGNAIGSGIEGAN